MTHKLMPPDGKPFLAPEEVVRRLREEFRFVETNAEEGRNHVQGMVLQFIKMERAGMVEGEHIDRLQKARESAVMLVVADDELSQDAKLRFAVIPGEPIIVGYWSGRHQRLAEPLLKRCSQALGYPVAWA